MMAGMSETAMVVLAPEAVCEGCCTTDWGGAPLPPCLSCGRPRQETPPEVGFTMSVFDLPADRGLALA
jgi:hypothetical protein